VVLYVLAIVGGIFGLVVGADRFVNGAVTLARGLGISSLIVGLTVVSLGTSLPELLVTVTATLVGHPHVAVGNVLGSNIANIGLILGVSSLVRPIESTLSSLSLQLLCGLWPQEVRYAASMVCS